MTSFIDDVLQSVIEKHQNFSELIFILPSKRAGVFLKHRLSKTVNTTIFAPDIVSIEAFTETLSQLKPISNSELLFRFYNSYLELTPEEAQVSFDAFAKWAQTLLQDFNEIDRYLIPHKDIFDYLSAIQELNHWSTEDHQTDVVTNYLSFWKKLKSYYEHYTDALLNSGTGYQGILYREAVEHLESYIQTTTKTHIFIGFNALNKAESHIIQELLHNNLAEIYWDIDKTFIEDSIHDAGYFTRIYRKEWRYFENHPFNWVTTNYTKEKHISAIGVSKQVGQAKAIGNILQELIAKNGSVANTAVVLGEEDLLIPVLNSIPESVNTLNITMGLPLKAMPLVSLFDQLLSIHKKNATTFYYKDVISVLSHQLIRPIFQTTTLNEAEQAIKHLQKHNIIYISYNELAALFEDHKAITELLFSDWNHDIAKTIDHCSKLIFKIKAALDADKEKHLLKLEYLYRIHLLFNQIRDLNNTYGYIKSLSSLQFIYKELLSSETLDFRGEPLEGLQIMGMLESRVLDFDTVIISSVNEGILPAGKSNTSFIPYDVKRENNLPTYKEKDAVYTYHFYRLLQRAKQVYIVYNTEVEALKGGEKSRFITQLDIEGIHNIKHSIAVSEVATTSRPLQSVEKTEAILKRIEAIALKGFSPSSLTNYIRNPIDFYYEKLLGINTQDDIEETIAANTLGSVIHNTLETFYKPAVNSDLTEAYLRALIPKIEETVESHFKILYKEGTLKQGKNLIIFEVAKRYIQNFIMSELQHLKEGHQIQILAIEADCKTTIEIPELAFPVTLTGKIDRIDRFNGQCRIIDYKTGKVDQGKVEIVNWEDITTDYTKYSKSFQLLTYAYMLYQENQIHLPVEAGIIPFKTLDQGLIKFAQRPSEHSRKKDTLITENTLQAFEVQLKALIVEICNPDRPFIEKDLS